MDHIGRFCILLTLIAFQFSIAKSVFSLQKREWVDDRTTKFTEGDVACFSEYMEMWIHSAKIEGLAIWLSQALRIQVNLSTLDHLNQLLSACGFSLHKDAHKNFTFRVSYTGCFVQQQHSFHKLTLNLVKRINRFGGRPHNFIMTCPVVSAPPCREQIQCDPEYIQVIRQVPYDNWNNELHWSLSLSDHLIVSLEDASLIQMNVDMNGPDIAVQGRRREVLSPVKVMEKEGEFLALKLVSGQYAYSMEATCPKDPSNTFSLMPISVTTSTAEETVLHIFKRRMGLTKRGSYDSEELTVSHVSVNQTDNFTMHEMSGFVTLIIPTDRILQTKTCAESKHLLQPFYRVDVVLTFKETNHKMHWTMENMLPCTAQPAWSHLISSLGPNNTTLSMQHFKAESVTQELFLDHTTAPVEKHRDRPPIKAMAEFSSINSPNTHTGGSSFYIQAEGVSGSQSGNFSAEFDGDEVSSVRDFYNATMNSSAVPDFKSSGVTEQPSTTPFHTAVTPERTYQLKSTNWTRGQQEHKDFKWIW